MKKNNPIYKTIAILIFLFVLMGGFQTLTAKEDIKTITILPFKIHAQEKLSHIQDGIVQMLYSRLSWKDNVLVVPQKQLASHLSAIDKTKTDKGINEIARLTHSDFVLEGAITQLGGSFSIDVQVYDIENKRYMAFFEQSQQKDDLISKTNRIAARINKKIFDRSTMAWEKMDQEKKSRIHAAKSQVAGHRKITRMEDMEIPFLITQLLKLPDLS